MDKQLFVTTIPNFSETNLNSFCWFLEYGLSEELRNFASAINSNTNLNIRIYSEEFVFKKPRYSALQCKKYDLSYAVRIYVPIELIQEGKVIESLAFFGEIPLMTEEGTFIINGCERVIINQIIRSAGIYYRREIQEKSISYSGTLISDRGSWLKFEFLNGTVQIRFNKVTVVDFYQLIEACGLSEVDTNLGYSLRPPQRVCYEHFIAKDSDLLNQNLSNKLELSRVSEVFNNPVVFESNILQIFDEKFDNLGRIGREKLNAKLGLNIPSHVTRVTIEDITAISDYLLKLHINIGELDDIDNLRNRRVRSVGELLQIQFGIGLNRLERSIRERLIISNSLISNAASLINPKPIIASIKEFFGSSQLSQFMDQTNPIASLTHKRRISSLGPGGLNRDRLSLAMRDIHPSHYGRICPIETPEGQNAGLIASLASYARINESGFLETPFFKIIDGHVLDQSLPIYLTTEEEELLPTAPADFVMTKSNAKIESLILNETISIEFDNKVVRLVKLFLDEKIYKTSDSKCFIRNNDEKAFILRCHEKEDFSKKVKFSFASRTLNHFCLPTAHTVVYSRKNTIGPYQINGMSLAILAPLNNSLDGLHTRVLDLKSNFFRKVIKNADNWLWHGKLVYPGEVICSDIEVTCLSYCTIFDLDSDHLLLNVLPLRQCAFPKPCQFLQTNRTEDWLGKGYEVHSNFLFINNTLVKPGLNLIETTLVLKKELSSQSSLRFLKLIKIQEVNRVALFEATRVIPSQEQLIPIRYNNEFSLVPLNQVKLVSVSPLQNFSIATTLIPFLEHDDANRALMGSNMQRQSIPLLYPHKPIVGTGLEHQVANDSGAVVITKFDGVVKYTSARLISIETSRKEIVTYKLQKFNRSNQDTCINQRPIVWPNEKVYAGQIIADGPGTNGGELALGQNILVAYMPWEGYNYEDAILINERLVQEDLFTSVHIEKFDVEIRQTSFGVEQITRDLPNITDDNVRNLDANGIICKGAFVKSGDILVGKVTPKAETDQLPEGRLLRAIFGERGKNVSDSSIRVSKGNSGRVVNVRVFRRTKGYDFVDGSISLIRIFIAQVRKIQVGDKIAGRHGNKGIISRVLPKQDMPFLPNGQPVDILLNPLGVPSRMNVGQIFECLLGLAGSKLNRRFKVMPFDEMYGIETSRNLVNHYLNEASNKSDEPWLFNSSSPGRVELRDGRTGLAFHNPILIGTTYMLKLIHQVDDKMHARSTGPYSLITQQPLGGKSRLGGQRFGEMEVWALEAFGCAYTLQELLTLKSDDMEGRNEVLNAIVKGLPIPKPGIPESFKVLIRELHALGLDISLYKMNKTRRGHTNEFEVDLLVQSEKNLKRSLPLRRPIKN
jgi:DNA-directed RNA polymerase beta subunit